MPYTIKTGYLNVKDENGQYIRNNTVAEQSTAEQVADIEAAGTAQVTAINTKGVETLESIPDDYTALSNEVDDIKNELSDYNAADILSLYGSPSNGTSNYVTYTFTGKNTCKAVGTASSTSFRNIYANTTVLPHGVTAGGKLYFKVSTTNSDLRLAVIFYKSGGTYYPFNYISSDRVLNVPSDTVGLTIRVDVASGKTVDDTVTYSVLATLTNKELEEKQSAFISAKDATLYVNSDQITLSNIVEDGFYVLSQSWTVSDAPTGLSVTGLTVEHFSTTNQSGFVKQIAEDLVHPTTTKRYYRFSNYNGSAWSDWVELGGDNHTNEYIFNEYYQTVELSASPQITADTNNYLAPTGDTTDRTADIIAMLTSSKVCRLGTGDYYINGLQMPDNTAIIGSGSGTKIHLSGTADGYAIKPGSYCTLSDFMLMGSSSGLTFGDTIGGRHGILWQGNYTENQTAPWMTMISNVLIRDFSGGGITCYDTGYGTFNAIEATNIIILGCWAGLNISYWSEFHKFTNVRCYSCRVGCVNNGGNNIFINCDFSSSKEIGMLMDNSQSQSPNNSHGSCIGCVFNHTASAGVSNSGIGIKMLNCDNGFMFTGCQIFFSKIDIEDSDGVVFSNCNIGQNNCNIIINGGGTVLFSGNMHQGAPSSGTWISVTDNENVHFVNCYNRSTGASVQPS